jgi:hypothetical protein
LLSGRKNSVWIERGFDRFVETAKRMIVEGLHVSAAIHEGDVRTIETHADIACAAANF